jgi:hypothetical protein
MVYGKRGGGPDSATAERPEVNDMEDAERHWLYGKSFMGRLDGQKYLLLWKAAAQARDRVLHDLEGGQMQMANVTEEPVEKLGKTQTTEGAASTQKTSPER